MLKLIIRTDNLHASLELHHLLRQHILIVPFIWQTVWVTCSATVEPENGRWNQERDWLRNIISRRTDVLDTSDTVSNLKKGTQWARPKLWNEHHTSGHIRWLAPTLGLYFNGTWPTVSLAPWKPSWSINLRGTSSRAHYQQGPNSASIKWNTRPSIT